MRRIMKHAAIFLMSLTIITGCGKTLELKLTDSAIEYTSRESSLYNCVEIVYDEKVYRPFAVAEMDMIGDEVVGYVSDEGEEISEYILSVVGENTDQWLISVLNDGEHDCVTGENLGFLLKEESVTDIPENFKAEESYEWNFLQEEN